MYDLQTSFGASPRGVNTPVDADAPRTPVLITEQQVLFATAASMPLRQAKPGRRWAGTARTIGVRLRAALQMISNDDQPHRRRYPSRQNFLEDSRMTREMLRL